MLVLTRRFGEEIVIDGQIVVTVVAIDGNKVRLGITAPKSISVDRSEVHERRAQFADQPSCLIEVAVDSCWGSIEPVSDSGPVCVQSRTEQDNQRSAKPEAINCEVNHDRVLH